MTLLVKQVVFLGFILFLQGCSIKQIAVGKLGDTLAEGGNVFASDDDIELVGDALPFTLKTVESLLVEVPEHKGLLYPVQLRLGRPGSAGLRRLRPRAGERNPAASQEVICSRPQLCPACGGTDTG